MTIDEAHEFTEVSSYGEEIDFSYKNTHYFFEGWNEEFDPITKKTWRNKDEFAKAQQHPNQSIGWSSLCIFPGDGGKIILVHEERSLDLASACKWILTDPVFDGRTFWEAYPEIEWID